MSTELIDIFFAHFAHKSAEMANGDKDFIHYTSPEAALNIIKTGKFWLRNTTVMNDATEVYHGTNLVREFFTSDDSAPFYECLNRLVDDGKTKLIELYDSWIHDLETNTYVACLSEHDRDANPDGLLSMWRAYGRSGGVALVLNPFFANLETDHLQTFSYPALYQSDQQAFELFRGLSQRFVMGEQRLRQHTPENIIFWCFHTLQTFGITLKHPAFAEEREWRVVHRPLANPSELVKPKTHSINGVPQVIYELPINEDEREDQKHINVERLLKAIIIGPCDAPQVISKALVAELEPYIGLDKAHGMIHYSNIPLRYR